MQETTQWRQFTLTVHLVMPLEVGFGCGGRRGGRVGRPLVQGGMHGNG